LKILYTGNGSTVLFSFTFEYIEEVDVEVSINSVTLATTEYSLANSTTIEFNTAPASGAAIRIYRNTTVNDPKATFFPGSAIRAQDLNDNFEQILFVTQEADAISERAELAADQAQIATTAALAASATATTAATSAQAAASTAQAQVNAAQTAASNAATDANTAVTTANSAVTTANNAVIAANTANTNAGLAASDAAAAATSASSAATQATSAQAQAHSAASSASAAQTQATAAGTSATSAQTSASNALNQANAAAASANTAATDAATAVSTANTASSDASTALTAANNAVSTANGSAATANTASTNAASAVTTANTAASDASSAVSTANTAATNAASALSTANTAASDASTALSTANTADTNATAAVSTANTASSSSTTAVNTANGAATTANSASTDASTALSTANTASTNASSAVSTANQASTDASTAISNASTAQTTANSAVTTANAASTTASNAASLAQSAANTVASSYLFSPVAAVANIPSNPSNNDAIRVVNSTNIESTSSVQGVPSGFVGDSGINVEIIYSSSASKWNYIAYNANDPDDRYGYPPYVDVTRQNTVDAATLSGVALNDTDLGTFTGSTIADSSTIKAALQDLETEVETKADLVGGVVPTSQLPALAVTEFLGTAANQTAMLALTGQRGDFAIRSDTGSTFVLTSDGGSTLSDWQELETPTDAIQTVNGQTGTVVLGPSDVSALATAGGTMTGDITFNAGQTFDGRDVSADGSKLDGIESGATGDQTNAEIRAAVEAATDSNVFTDADHTKLNGIAAGAEVNVDTNLGVSTSTTAVSITSSTGADISIGEATGSAAGVMSVAHHNKLDGIEASATADQSAAEIRTLVGSASDSNVFTDALKNKLNAIEANATADQTKAEIDALNINASTLDTYSSSDFLLSGSADTASGDITFSGGAGAVSIAAASDIRFASGAWTGEHAGKIQYHDNSFLIQFSSQVMFRNSGGSNVVNIDSSGNIIADGNVTAYSDIRLKKDIEVIPHALDKVLSLRGVTYTDKETEDRRTGVLAQDVQAVLPEAVMEGEEYLSVAYGNLVGLLIESIKELEARVSELELL